MSKSNRQFALKQIIQEQNIGSQEELVHLLKKAGFEVTQATLSRDLKEMGVGRANTSEGLRYTISSDTSDDLRLRMLLSYEIEAIEHNESLIVIHTLPGRAQGVAELIDSIEHEDVMATLAGDNTIFVAPRSITKIKQVVKDLKEFITTSS